MTDAAIPHPFKLDEQAQEVTARMRAIESVFASNGLTTHLTDARAGLDLSAMLSPSGKREAEIWVDENGYAELRYWSPEGSSPEQIATAALLAFRAITGATPTDFAQRAAVQKIGARARKSAPRQAWRCSSMSTRSHSLAGGSCRRRRRMR